MTATSPSDHGHWLWVRVKATKPVSFIKQTVTGDDARIEAGDSIKKKLEFPVSINESQYELRQQQTLIPFSFFKVKM